MFQSQPQDPSPQNQRRRQMFLLALFALGVLVLGRMGVLDDGGFLGGGLGNTGAEQVRYQPFRTVADLERAVARTGYDLRALAAGDRAPVPRMLVDRLPADWPELAAPQRERLFVALLLPLILSVNDRMETLRDRLATIADAPDPGALSDAELAFLRDSAAALAVPGLTAARAGQEPLAVARDLAARLGPLPVALTLAQAARDSDWGLATAGSGGPGALFTAGQAERLPAGPFAAPFRLPGTAGGDDPAGAGGDLAAADLWSAVASHAMTLAALPRFAAYRAERQALDARHAAPDGPDLASALVDGGDARPLQTLMAAHGLTAYGAATLAPPPALVLIFRPAEAAQAGSGPDGMAAKPANGPEG